LAGAVLQHIELGGDRAGVTREMCAGSWGNLGEEFAQPDEVVGGHCEGELPIDLEQPAMPHLAQAGEVLAQPKASSTRLRMRCEIA
jgi:hypothetical protein